MGTSIGSVTVISKRKHSTVRPLAGQSVVQADRTNPDLGNPFELEDANDAQARQACILEYQTRFKQLVQDPTHATTRSLQKLVTRVQQGEHIALACWCKPKACHADIIADYIREHIKPEAPSLGPIAAIIGTAGRGEDAQVLTKEYFTAMCAQAEGWVLKNQIKHLVSGGAAWADHVAVMLYLKGVVPALTLHCPAAFNGTQFADNGVIDWQSNPGGTTNNYHRKFSHTCGFNSFAHLAEAQRKGAKFLHAPTLGYDPMQERNQRVANMADIVLAMTFGTDTEVKDGGTKKTVLAFQRTAAILKREAPTYHINLHNFALHKLSNPYEVKEDTQTELSLGF